MGHLEVKNQYEKFPYPKSNFFWKPRINSANNASYEKGVLLTQQKSENHAGKKILLLGCGTNEPLAMALSHPHAKINAIDISENSLRAAKLKCRLRGVKNVTYVAQDILDYADDFNFDFIHSYGVLHHLENPVDGFGAIKNLMAPKGFARVMVYSKSARQKISDLRRFFQILNIDFKSKNFKTKISKIIKILPTDHPLRLTFEMHPEIKSTSGLVDAFLHSQETAFQLSEILQILDKHSLEIKAWDFSPNVLNLLKEANGNSTIEKIQYLEATEQWPSSFTFWFTHKNVAIPQAHTQNSPRPVLPQKGGGTLSELKTVRVHWYLERYHRAGLSFQKMSHDRQWSQIQQDELLKNISVIAAPRWLYKKNPTAVDEDGRIKAFNSEIRIRNTQKISAKNGAVPPLNFSEATTSATALKLKYQDSHTPNLQGQELDVEFRATQKKGSALLISYEALSPWEKLEFLEIFWALTKSHTTMEFQPIDFVSTSA